MTIAPVDETKAMNQWTSEPMEQVNQWIRWPIGQWTEEKQINEPMNQLMNELANGPTNKLTIKPMNEWTKDTVS